MDDAKKKVESAIDTYINSTISLIATIGTTILVKQKDKEILKRLGTGVTKKRQTWLSEHRASGSGLWVLESAQYKAWVGDGPSTLICWGIGIHCN